MSDAVRLWTFHCGRYPEILYLPSNLAAYRNTLLLPGFKLIHITMRENSARRVPTQKPFITFPEKLCKPFYE